MCSRRVCASRAEWLGWLEPDPNNVHYPVMIDAIQKLMESFGHKAEDIYLWIE